MIEIIIYAIIYAILSHYVDDMWILLGLVGLNVLAIGFMLLVAKAMDAGVTVAYDVHSDQQRRLLPGGPADDYAEQRFYVI